MPIIVEGAVGLWQNSELLTKDLNKLFTPLHGLIVLKNAGCSERGLASFRMLRSSLFVRVGGMGMEEVRAQVQQCGEKGFIRG